LPKVFADPAKTMLLLMLLLDIGLGRIEQSSAQQKEFADRPWGCIGRGRTAGFPKAFGSCMAVAPLIPCGWRAKLCGLV